MSLIIEGSRDSTTYSSIVDPSGRHKSRCGYLGEIPQQVWDCPPQTRIDISEESNHYALRSELLGVELKNLWVHIEGRTLSIYATVTGERQESGEYRYAEKLLGGIRGEIVLPDQAFRIPRRAEFDDGVLSLIFPKKTDAFFESLALSCI